MKLSKDDFDALRFMADHFTPLFPIAFQNGGDAQLNRLIKLGLVDETRRSFVLGPVQYDAGYLLTNAGRRLALRDKQP